MKHISIEGMDGVGKTTVCKLLAKRLGYKFVEKPLHYLFDDKENEIKICQKINQRVNANPNRNFTAWYYGLNNIYLYDKFKNQNIVTDRHIVSNYCWSGTDFNQDIYDLILKKIGKPTLTIILYAKKECILERLKSRNSEDSDIKRIDKSEKVYERMIGFCKKRKFPYMIVDSSYKSPNEVVDIIIKKINGK